MHYDRSKLKWNGWGWNDSHYEFEAGEDLFWEIAVKELEIESLNETPPKRFDALERPPSRLGEQIQNQLQTLLGDGFSIDAYERVFHARGRSYRDLLDLRAGTLGELPDAVVYPRTPADVEALLTIARDQHLALIPFGGGSSVVGGVNAARGQGQQGILTLDTTRMNRLLRLDPTSLTATFECGIYGPKLEEILNAQGFTAGHSPQSFEFSTLGGWIAARGAGERSNRYGKMEDILVSARVLTPAGEWRTLSLPASAAGPDLNQLIAGSEGLFGVIVEATIRIHPLPATHHHTGFLFKDFASGLEAARRLSQSAHPPALLRLSDEDETKFLFSFRKKPAKVSKSSAAIKQVLAWRGYTESPALLLTGLEGDHREVLPQVPGLTAACAGAGGFPLGTSAAASWSKSRYSTPYLRDSMLDKGIGVETLETAAEWSRLPALYTAVRATLRESIESGLDQGGLKGKAFIMTHVSHCYRDGASLYFTFVFPQLPGREHAQYDAIKTAACEAILGAGGTLSHHHGLGADHAPWIAREKGELGLGILQAVKQRLDPEGILNPGKWL